MSTTVPLLARARSFLFVPADRPERLHKALASGADAVIVDLEDAVAPLAKDGARQALRRVWSTVEPAARAQLLVRLNAAGTAEHAGDVTLVAALAREGLGGVVVPKAEDPAVLAAVAAACPGAALLPLVESGAAFHTLDALAAAPQVLRLCLGHLDLQSDLGMRAGEDEAELACARWALVLATRRAGLAAPVDGVTTALSDPARLIRDTQRALRAGFGAKLCIHPAQVPVVHEALRPTPEESAWARRVLQAAEAANGAAVQVDGRMVDAPVIQLARQLAARERVAA